MRTTPTQRPSPLVVAAIPTDTLAGRSELRGVSDAARRLGWTLETIDPAITGIDLKPSLPLLSRADGVIARLYDTLADGTLASLGIPLVALDVGQKDKMPHSRAAWAHILCNQEMIADAAAAELLATGRRAFAFVPMLRRHPWTGRRGDAFLKRIRDAGCEAHLYEPKTEYDWIGERDALATWLAAMPRPFGVFAGNDLLAKLVYEACRTAGLAIPRDAAVIGADDDETFCLSVDPPLSSVRIDFEGAGRKAAEALDGLMGQRGERGRDALPRVHSGRAEARPSRPIIRYGILGVARRASTGSGEPGEDRRLAIGLDFIARHFRDPFVGAPDVARAMGLGRRQADRLFAASGKPIRARFEEARLASACSMLSSSEAPVKEIAALCGFASANYFARLVRSRTGRSPTQWRGGR